MKSGSPSRTTATHKTQTKTQAWSSLVFQCRHSSFYSFRSSSVGLETGEWRRCRSLSFTPPASLRSHGSRPRPTRHRGLYSSLKCSNVPYLRNAAVKRFQMRCACSMGCPILELTINFLYLLEMVSLYPCKSNNVPFMENAAVKWFHMRCACSMGCPI